MVAEGVAGMCAADAAADGFEPDIYPCQCVRTCVRAFHSHHAMDCCKHNRLDVRSESVNLRRDLFRHLAPRQKGWLPLVAQAFFRIKDCAALEGRIGSLQMDSFSLAASPADKSLTMVSNTAMWCGLVCFILVI